MAILSYNLHQAMQQRTLMVLLLFIALTTLVAGSDEHTVTQEAPAALFHEDTWDASVPSKMTTVQLLFHPRLLPKDVPAFQTRIAHRAAHLDTLAGRPAAAAELTSPKEAKTWAARTIKGVGECRRCHVVDVHVVLWMDPSRFKSDRAVRAKLLQDAAVHFNVPPRTLRVHLAEYLDFSSEEDMARKKKASGKGAVKKGAFKVDRQAAEDVVSHLGEYLDIAWSYGQDVRKQDSSKKHLEQDSSKKEVKKVAATPTTILKKSAKGKVVQPLRSSTVELMFEGGKPAAINRWARVLQSRTREGLVIRGKRRFPRLARHVLLDVVTHAAKTASPWTGDPLAATMSLTLAMSSATFWKGGREDLMVSLARTFHLKKDSVRSLGNLIQVDLRTLAGRTPTPHPAALQLLFKECPTTAPCKTGISEAEVASRAATLSTLGGHETRAAQLLSPGTARTWSASTEDGRVVDVHVILDASKDSADGCYSAKHAFESHHAQIVEEAAQHFGVPAHAMRVQLAESLEVVPTKSDGPAVAMDAEEVVTELDQYLAIAWGPTSPSPPADHTPVISQLAPDAATTSPDAATTKTSTKTFTLFFGLGHHLPFTNREGHRSGLEGFLESILPQPTSGHHSPMWLLLLLGFVGGLLVAVLLVRRRPRFAPATVELLASEYGKAAM